VSRKDRRTEDIADLLVWHTLSQPATLGTGWLLCVDGPAGSGKTTLAEEVRAVAAAQCSVHLVHLDDIYEGWSGLRDALPRVERDLVAPLRTGTTGRYRRYDWDAGRPAEWHDVRPVDLLVLEGVGSGASAYDRDITTLVWVAAPRELRLARGVSRDGSQVLPHWLRWMEEEDVVLAEERTRERADVLVDGTGDRDEAVVFV
jgi:uridine kinase